MRALLIALLCAGCSTPQHQAEQDYRSLVAERQAEARNTTPTMQQSWFANCPMAFELLQAVRGYRSELGLPQWQVDPALMRAAMNHASDTAARDYLSSTSPEGTTFAQRISRSGYPRWGRGENLAQAASAEKVLSLWTQSQQHVANLKLTDAYFVGVGCAEASPGTYNWVLVLGR